MLTSTVLVLFMTLPGLALFYAGLVRAKNVLSVLMHCVAVACLVSVLWYAGAYSLAFVGNGPWIGDLSQAFLVGVARGAAHPGTTIPDTVYIMYQMTFAIITPGLIIGAYVERIKFSAVLLFSGLWLIFVYAPVAHWVWGGGWLATMGVKDFAGGIVVHTTAGVSALVVAIALGKRDGFPQHLQPPHAPWIVMVGAAMLWVGWFGFNAGSALAASADAGMAMLVTHMAAAVASLTWMALSGRASGSQVSLEPSRARSRASPPSRRRPAMSDRSVQSLSGWSAPRSVTAWCRSSSYVSLSTTRWTSLRCTASAA